VTHRIQEITEKDTIRIFHTKGDANNTKDIGTIPASAIKGKVILSVPYFGYLSDWIRKPFGFVFLVIIPALLLIIGEIFQIKKVLEEDIQKKYEQKLKVEQNNKKLILTIVFFIILNVFFAHTTNSFFSDFVIKLNNTFSTSTWIGQITPTPTTDPCKKKKHHRYSHDFDTASSMPLEKLEPLPTLEPDECELDPLPTDAVIPTIPAIPPIPPDSLQENPESQTVTPTVSIQPSEDEIPIINIPTDTPIPPPVN
jgi:hypothetical protein